MTRVQKVKAAKVPPDKAALALVSDNQEKLKFVTETEIAKAIKEVGQSTSSIHSDLPHICTGIAEMIASSTDDTKLAKGRNLANELRSQLTDDGIVRIGRIVAWFNTYAALKYNPIKKEFITKDKESLAAIREKHKKDRTGFRNDCLKNPPHKFKVQSGSKEKGFDLKTELEKVYFKATDIQKAKANNKFDGPINLDGLSEFTSLIQLLTKVSKTETKTSAPENEFSIEAA